jgi:uncharacterized membrane protein YfcA
LTLILLFLAAFIAGLIDSIAGGGGLITLPALLSAGLPPQVALGTNKLQGSFGSGSAMLHFVRAGEVRIGECLAGIAWTAIGALLGAWAVQLIDPGLLRLLIPWFLGGIALYTLLSPKLGMEDIRSRWQTHPFYLVFGLGLGFYDGFLGPGTGSFWVVAFIFFLGYSMVRATAHTKVMNFTSNIVALLFFLSAGQVHAMEGLTMGAGQFLGARIGARLAIRKGAPFIRPIFIAMVLLMLVKLILQDYK